MTTDRGFAHYHAGNESHNDTPLPDGNPTGTPEQALDCTLDLHLADPNTWIHPRRINAVLH